MTEDRHFKWSYEPLCFCLYLGLNPHPLCSWASVLTTRPQWQMRSFELIGFEPLTETPKGSHTVNMKSVSILNI